MRTKAQELIFKWYLARRPQSSYFAPVKTATIQQVPEQWADILKWVASGEEVQMTDHDKVVAKLVPADGSQPDFVSRAKAIWGENPPGKPLSAIIADARGGETCGERLAEIGGFFEASRDLSTNPKHLNDFGK